MDLTEALHAAQAAVERRREDSFTMVRDGSRIAVVAGSVYAVQTPNGTIVTVYLTRDRLQELRTLCNALLAEADE